MGDVRERIQKLLVTGDNRLKQGVAPEKVRETYEQALELAREAGMEDGSDRSSSSGSPTSSGSQEDLLHPLRLPPDVVGGGRLAGRVIGARPARLRE